MSIETEPEAQETELPEVQPAELFVPQPSFGEKAVGLYNDPMDTQDITDVKSSFAATIDLLRTYPMPTEKLNKRCVQLEQLCKFTVNSLQEFPKAETNA